MKHNTAPTFESATKQTDKELLARLLTQPHRTGRKSQLTVDLDGCTDGEFVEFVNADNKRLATQVAAYNARHADRHFTLRQFNLKTYAVKVAKPAPRTRKAKAVVATVQAVPTPVNTPAVEAAKAVFTAATKQTTRSKK